MQYVGVGLVEGECHIYCSRPNRHLRVFEGTIREDGQAVNEHAKATMASSDLGASLNLASISSPRLVWCSVTSLRTSRALENVGIRWTSWTSGRTCDTARYEKASLWWRLRR
jgi:hypothetical protein